MLGTEPGCHKDTVNGRCYINCHCGSPEAREREREKSTGQSRSSVAEKAFLGNSNFVPDLQEFGWVKLKGETRDRVRAQRVV